MVTWYDEFGLGVGTFGWIRDWDMIMVMVRIRIWIKVRVLN